MHLSLKVGGHKEAGFPKYSINYYFATKNAEDKPFENNGSGTKGNMFMTTAACGIADGMLYKEDTLGAFVFNYPVEESGEYKFCDLLKTSLAIRKILYGCQKQKEYHFTTSGMVAWLMVFPYYTISIT